MAAMGPPSGVGAAARRLLRQRTVSLPLGLQVEPLPLPRRSPSLTGRQSGGVRAWLLSMLGASPAEEVEIAGTSARLWRSQSHSQTRVQSSTP